MCGPRLCVACFVGLKNACSVRDMLERTDSSENNFMKIAAAQMVSTPQVEENLATARHLIQQAAEQGAELIALPEYFCAMGHKDRDKLQWAESPGSGPIQEMLQSSAREHGLWVIGGTLPMRIANDAEHVANATCVYNPQGELAARYDKMHLFRFESTDGKERHDEAQTLRAGDAPVAFSTGEWRVGLSICYDLRFPELYRALMTPPCDLLVVPAAFTYPTGVAHWELLLRARAVENQCYVLASGQGGHHINGRHTFGHSMVIDPWGEVLAGQAEGEGVVMAELSTQKIKDVRTRLPALSHRRL
jgi:deaminated glutathione amidase